MKTRIMTLIFASLFLLALKGCSHEPVKPWRDYPSNSLASSILPSASPSYKPTPIPTPTPLLFSGKCGDSLSWSLTEAGKLTISGTGEMYNYACNWDYGGLAENSEITKEDLVKEEAPWKYTIWKEAENGGREIEIKEVELQNGITSIGAGAFFAIRSIETITIPDSVVSIGDQAFGCMELKEIILPAGLNNLSEGAFAGGRPELIRFTGTWTQWKALTGAPPEDYVEVKIDDRADDTAVLKGLVESGEYHEYTDMWESQPTLYKILDIGEDGSFELILSTDTDSVGFSRFAILTVDSNTGVVNPVEFLDAASQKNPYSYCHNGLRLSKEYNAIVYKAMNNGLVFGAFEYYTLDGNELSLLQVVSYDTMTGSGKTVYSLGKDGEMQSLSEEEYHAILDEAEFIEFDHLPGM